MLNCSLQWCLLIWIWYSGFYEEFIWNCYIHTCIRTFIHIVYLCIAFCGLMFKFGLSEKSTGQQLSKEDNKPKGFYAYGGTAASFRKKKPNKVVSSFLLFSLNFVYSLCSMLFPLRAQASSAALLGYSVFIVSSHTN